MPQTPTPRRALSAALILMMMSLACARTSPRSPAREAPPPAQPTRAITVEARAPDQPTPAQPPAVEPASLPADARVPGRLLHTATPLGAGRAVVVGGYTRGADVRGALSGSLRTDDGVAWSLGPSIGPARWGHTATRVQGDTLVLLGGSRDDPERSPFRHAAPGRWEPGTGAWTPLADPDRHAARVHHTATRLDDGAVLVVGGLRSYEAPLDTAALLDPRSGRWTALPPLPQGARFDHTATRLSDGRVLIAGGRISAGCGEGCPIDCLEDEDCPEGLACADGFFCTRPRASALLFEPAARRWRVLSPLPQARFGHSAARIVDGRVVVAGGFTSRGPTADVVVLDPKTLTWSAGPPLPSARWDHAEVVLDDGRLVLTGGRAACPQGALDATGEPCQDDRPQQALGEVLALASDLSAWRALPSLLRPRYHHTVHHAQTGPGVSPDGGRLVVWGGAEGSGRSVPGGEGWALDRAGWRALGEP